MKVFSLNMIALSLAMVTATDAHAKDAEALAAANAKLLEQTAGKGFGPQSPRDLTQLEGANPRTFSAAPDHDEMNLCNIHFHKNAEHKGGEFTTFAGYGDGNGFNTGYIYNGELSDAHLTAVEHSICAGPGGSLQPGDTIEAHYVFTSAQVNPGPTLGACLSESSMNPQLRVEGQVYVLVNDADALDFNELAAFDTVDGYVQPLNIPSDTGEPIEYAGSTTGPAYNEQGSPLKVSWSVRPQVAFVNIHTVGKWCEGNIFNETAAHGVRNLVTHPELISDID